jgi:hypothetical protein
LQFLIYFFTGQSLNQIKSNYSYGNSTHFNETVSSILKIFGDLGKALSEHVEHDLEVLSKRLKNNSYDSTFWN